MRVVVGGAVVVVVLAGVYSLSGIASVASPKVATSGSRSGNQFGSKVSPTASTSAPPCGPRVLTATSGPVAPLGGFKVAFSDILTNSGSRSCTIGGAGSMGIAGPWLGASATAAFSTTAQRAADIRITGTPATARSSAIVLAPRAKAQVWIITTTQDPSNPPAKGSSLAQQDANSRGTCYFKLSIPSSQGSPLSVGAPQTCPTGSPSSVVTYHVVGVLPPVTPQTSFPSSRMMNSLAGRVRIRSARNR